MKGKILKQQEENTGDYPHGFGADKALHMIQKALITKGEISKPRQFYLNYFCNSYDPLQSLTYLRVTWPVIQQLSPNNCSFPFNHSSIVQTE